jgi:lipopolysaccharide biosynthesis glycosyltransferase
MKRNLIVTLANKNYVNQAKQLFSSVYFNAGWKGDYMLLSHEIPEKDLKWFRKKGILIKKCKPLSRTKYGGLSPSMLDKFYLFTPEFRKWNVIVYLDADIIVRGSLDELTKVTGFAAVPDLGYHKLKDSFINPLDPKKNIRYYPEFLDILKNYSLNARAFNAGVFAFNTKIIKKEDFKALIYLTRKYKTIAVWGDQPIFNTFFYKKWQPTSVTFNMYYSHTKIEYNTEAKKIKCAVLHFCGKGQKPWQKGNSFYKEWKLSLDKADLIDLSKQLPAKEIWDYEKIKQHEKSLRIKHIKMYIKFEIIDKNIGRIGTVIKRISPKVYILIKNMIWQNKKNP